MTNNKQTQKGGNNSILSQYNTQLTTTNVFHGITEERARQVFSEMFTIARRDLSLEAESKAITRIKKFEDSLISRMTSVEGSLEAFSDPKFQFLLTDSQKVAASTTREEDYDLLTQLLLFHIQQGDKRKTRASIGFAIRVVDDIDIDSLCALTLVYYLINYRVVNLSCIAGLSELNSLFSKILCVDLPVNNTWLEHLDILDAVRINPLVSINKFEVIIKDIFSGYLSIGIEKCSAEYAEAVDILKGIGLTETTLIQNEFLDNYVKIPALYPEQISALEINTIGVTRPLHPNEIKAFSNIFELYSNTTELQQKMLLNFLRVWNSYELLNKVSMWWDSLTISFALTPVGNILSHTNLKRIVPELPPIVE